MWKQRPATRRLPDQLRPKLRTVHRHQQQAFPRREVLGGRLTNLLSGRKVDVAIAQIDAGPAKVTR